MPAPKVTMGTLKLNNLNELYMYLGCSRRVYIIKVIDLLSTN